MKAIPNPLIILQKANLNININHLRILIIILLAVELGVGPVVEEDYAQPHVIVVIGENVIMVALVMIVTVLAGAHIRQKKQGCLLMDLTSLIAVLMLEIAAHMVKSMR